ncbi:SDR family oxidoreductase [Pseudonocardia parietis]|uniref:(-)-trans-carveol dehydrogenase n=1 Tax=Pseudonocardia parietis TaxID=570936 RepID=A0ABS4VQI7_9PSEU|nr:SDR family oxidoreductase [Pseudonocardia parietis]MBP2366183.1 (-)-trans-carveol dehydrogenase [Pseudonocardia parietis]
MGKLDGKVAFITGAGRGQGASHAKYLAREGAKIIAVDICDPISDFYSTATQQELDDTVQAVKEIGSEALGLRVDVRDFDQVKNAVDRGLETFGQIDIVCNNAGMIRVDAIDEMSTHSLDVVVDICLKGTFNVVRCVAPHMKARRSGTIINTSSAGGLKALPYVSHYAAAKGGVILATQSWANELAEWDINVNAVAPGTIKTGMIIGLAGQAGQDPDEAFEQFNQNGLFKGEKGVVEVDDISKMIVFLASEDARTITGQTFPVDAGWTAS